MKTTRIYVLSDPVTNEIRYVGKTIQSLKQRLSSHLRETSKCHRCNWIKSLLNRGLKPNIALLEEVRGEWPWQESERFWIKYLRMHGHNLTNNTSGGDGVPDLPKETRDIIKSAWIGRKHKPETIQKLKTCRKNFKHSAETKRKMSVAHTGRIISWGDKISEAARKINLGDIAKIKKRLDEGEKVCDLSKEYGVHRTTMSKIKKGTYLSQK